MIKEQLETYLTPLGILLMYIAEILLNNTTLFYVVLLLLKPSGTVNTSPTSIFFKLYLRSVLE